MLHMINIKLTSANFLLWHAQIEPLLFSRKFKPLLDGSSLFPPAEIISTAGVKSANPNYASWSSRDQLLKLFLVSTLTEESMAVVIDCKTSKDVWQALNHAYNHGSKAREISLKDDLLSLKCGSLSVSEYSTKFKSLCDQLSAIGRTIDESDKSHWFLRGLGPSFNAFTIAQLTHELLPDLQTLLSRAQSHELFLRTMDDSSSPNPVAFAATTHGKGSNSSSGINKGFSSRGRGKQLRGRRPPWCSFCRAIDRDALDCPHRFDRSK